MSGLYTSAPLIWRSAARARSSHSAYAQRAWWGFGGRHVDLGEERQRPVEVARLPQPAGVVNAPREALVRGFGGAPEEAVDEPVHQLFDGGPGCGREEGMLVVAVVNWSSSLWWWRFAVVGRMSWWSTSAPRTRPAAFSAKSSRSPVRGSGPMS